MIHDPATTDRVGRVLMAVALVLLAAAPARAWGPLIHQRVTSEAIETLPKGLKPFYKAHRLELPSLALTPRSRRRAPSAGSPSTASSRSRSRTSRAPRPL